MPNPSKTLWLIVILSVVSCSTDKTQRTEGAVEESGTPIIRLAEAFDEKGLVNASTFTSKIEYIVLETSENTLYEPNVQAIFVPNPDQIIAKAFRRISLFDRKTGEYIKDIGHYGKDPESYDVSLPYMGPTTSGTVYAKDQRYSLVEYDIDQGAILRKIPEPMLVNTKVNGLDFKRAITSYGFLGDQFVVGFTDNDSGKDTVGLVLYNFKGELIKIFNNNQLFEKKTNAIFFIPQEGQFYSFKDELIFKEIFNDTAFSIAPDKLIPRYIFGLNEFSPPYNEKELLAYPSYITYEQMKESSHSDFPYMDKSLYMFISNLLESPEYLFFHLYFENEEYMCYYDKEEKQVYVSEPDKSITGFYNDVDGFVPFKPTSINPEGELIGIISAEEVLDWFDENPDKIASLPSALQALQNMDPEDNPLVMIAKPKY